jgi:hypothetical protein
MSLRNMRLQILASNWVLPLKFVLVICSKPMKLRSSHKQLNKSLHLTHVSVAPLVGELNR